VGNSFRFEICFPDSVMFSIFLPCKPNRKTRVK
jgi:hypothetical protein